MLLITQISTTSQPTNSIYDGLHSRTMPNWQILNVKNTAACRPVYFKISYLGFCHVMVKPLRAIPQALYCQEATATLARLHTLLHSGRHVEPTGAPAASES